jgi:predicted DNA-binding ribbon-helix-helix protein
MLIQRSLSDPHTTVALESVFWGYLDNFAKANNQKWHKYIKKLLESKPPGQNTASYLRCYVVESL